MGPPKEQIELGRAFDREYTRRLGVLTDQFLGQPRTLGEARLLYEIGERAEVRELRVRLDLDAGYMSRLLRSLQTQGLVQVVPHPADHRVRIAQLTEAGARERADLDQRAADASADLLSGLSAAQREQLIISQRQVLRLLRLAAVHIGAADISSADARFCLDAYAAECNARFPEGYDQSVQAKPADLGGNKGTFLIAREDERPVGCGLWCTADDSRTAEIRHLWVSPSARGIGLGRRLLGDIEADAAGHGITLVRLYTHSALAEADALYRASGYRQIPRFDDSPYNHMSFEKDCTPTG